MEAGEEKGGWETGFYFLIFTDIVKMGWDTKPRNQHETKAQKVRFHLFTRHCKYIAVLVVPRNVVDSIQAINGQNADKIIGLRVLNSLKTHKQS